MRVKTSVTLPEELLARIDRVGKNRSAVLEEAAEVYLARLEAERRAQHDLKTINTNAKRLNKEAFDVLEYQGLP